MNKFTFALEHPELAICDDWRSYRLLKWWTYFWRHDGVHRQLVVPAGFVTDLASVPRLVWSLIAPTDLGLAPVVHDYLYRHVGELPPLHDTVYHPIEERPYSRRTPPDRPWTRQEVDRLFGRLMREAGVARWRRRLAYLAVRAFGWRHWGGKRNGGVR